MKKILAALLALSMLLALSACAQNPGGTITPQETTAPAATDGPAQDATDFPEHTDPPQTTAPSSGEAETSLFGSIQGGTYENAFLGIGCVLDSNWSIATDEEMAQLNGIVADAITDEVLSEAIQNSGVVYDLYATADQGLVSMNIVLENLGVLYGIAMDEETYVNSSLDQLKTALTSMGMTDVTVEATTVKLAGADHAAVQVHGLYQDVDFYELVVCVKADTYMAAVTVGSYYEDVTDTVIDMFYAVEN